MFPSPSKATSLPRAIKLLVAALGALLFLNFIPVGFTQPLPPGSISFTSSTYSVNENGNTAQITLRREGGSSGAVTAKVSLSDITTSASQPDYTFTPGALDPSFNQNAGVSKGPDNLVRKVVVQPDGKILVGGFFSSYNGTSAKGIARINADGSLDTSFNSGIFAIDVNGIALQPDGKIVVVGILQRTANDPAVNDSRMQIARLNADGSPDTVFNTNVGTGFAAYGVQDIALAPDGKIVVVGNFPAYNGTTRNSVARINTDGTLDATFNGLTQTNFLEAVEVQPDGKVIIGGNFVQINGVMRHSVARLNTDGSLDTSYNLPAIIDELNPFSLLLQPDGKLLVGGAFYTNSAASDGTLTPLVRLNTDGTLDSSFTSTLGNDLVFRALTLQPDGKLLVSGGTVTNNPQIDPLIFINRLNTDGTTDTTFNNALNPLTNSGVYSIGFQPDGKLIVGGQFHMSANGLQPYEFLKRLNGDFFVTWQDGETSDKTISLPIVDDFVDEPDETLNLALTTYGAATAGTITNATLTIVDNEVPPSFTSALPPALIDEGVSFTHTFTATGSPAPIFYVSAGSLPSGLFLSSNGVLSGSPFFTGTGTFTFTVTATNDINPPATQSVTIKVNGRPQAFSDSYTVNEDQTLTVPSSTIQGVLSNDRDANNDPLTATLVSTTAHGSLTFNSDGSFVYTPQADYNGPDSFSYKISDGRIQSSNATVFITVRAVNDAPVNTVPAAQNAIENTSFTFSAANGNAISVSDIDGASISLRVTLKATNGIISLNGTSGLSFNAGDGINDTLMTFTGTASVINSHLNGLLFVPTQNYSGPASLQITTNDIGNVGGSPLTDDDTISINVQSGGLFQFTASAARVNETDGQLQVTVTRVGGSAGPATVDYVASDLTAKGGADYTPTSGTLSFAQGETTKTISVPITDDTLLEGSETFKLSLLNATGSASVGTPAVEIVTIIDNEAPFVELSSTTYSVNENVSSGFAAITVNRVGAVTTAFTVDYATTDSSGLTPCQTNTSGIASERCDYATAQGTLRFAAGETSKTISIPVINDAYQEPDETFSITLSNPKSANLGTNSTATVTIKNDDTTAPAQNPIADQSFFIKEQYIDFLGRVAEPAGFDFWMNRMNTCPQGQVCDRIDTSQRFFQSDEFQARGFYVYRLYDALLGRLPKYAEFVPDTARLNGFQTVAEQRQSKDAYLLDFINKQEFRNLYGAYLSADGLTATNPTGFVGALCARAGITPANKQALINNLQNGIKDPAHTLEDFILQPEMSDVGTLYYDRGFITMQYFGYLRRDPEQAGFDFWVSQLIGPNAPHKQDYRFMVGGFLQSDEYEYRFAMMSAH